MSRNGRQPPTCAVQVGWLSRGAPSALANCFPAQEFYQSTPDAVDRLVTLGGRRRKPVRPRPIGVSFIGAGAFAPSLVKHVLRERDVHLRGVADLQPTRARFMADLYGFAFCSTDAATVLHDDGTHCVFIVTDHHSHARLAASGVMAGKYVFVEKPPAVDHDQLLMLIHAVVSSSGVLQVGYNRRFAPLVTRLSEVLDGVPGPTVVHVNRRPYNVPRNSWYYWPKEGTRIVSNVCHFLDLAHQIAGRPRPEHVTSVHDTRGRPDENATITATFADGSVATVLFSQAGSPHERVTVQRGDTSLRLWHYSRLDVFKDGRQVGEFLEPSDYGHAAEVADFVRGYRESRPQFYELENLALTSAMTFAASSSLGTGETVRVDCDQVLASIRDRRGATVSSGSPTQA